MSASSSLSVSFSGSGQVVLDTSAGTFSSGTRGCGNARTTSTSTTLMMPSSGTVTLRAGYAGGYGTVTVAQVFTISVGSPPPPPPAPPVVNCAGSWGGWGSCSESCGGGTQQRTYAVTTAASGGGTACPSDSPQTQSCNAGACAENCAGSWGGWAACSVGCGDGTQQRTYAVTTAASGGGTACPSDSPQTLECNDGACPGSGGGGGPAHATPDFNSSCNATVLKQSLLNRSMSYMDTLQAFNASCRALIEGMPYRSLLIVSGCGVDDSVEDCNLLALLDQPDLHVEACRAVFEHGDQLACPGRPNGSG